MPTATDPGAERSAAEIVASTSDDDFLHHVIDGMRSTNCSTLINRLDALITERDADVEKLCSAGHHDIIGSILKLDQGRSDISSLGTDILDILQSYEENATGIVSRKKDVVDSSKLRLNISESTEELKGCLELLRRAKETCDSIGEQNYYAAAHIQLRSGSRYVENADILHRTMNSISVFINTMEAYEYDVSTLNTFLITLFENYLAILTQRCSDICQVIIANDDYMPMPIVDVEEYDKVIEACGYEPELARKDITLPCSLPFSQVYPLCGIEIRNFLKHVYSGYDICMRRTNVIEDMIQHSVDELLCEGICERLLERLNLQYIGQSVQVCTNLEHFERSCGQLQSELAAFSKSRAGSGLVVLHAPKAFRSARAKAYDRILELVISKIDDLIETSEYGWRSNSEADEPSNYMMELTRYIADINSSALIDLPQETRELVYFEVIGHVASTVLTLPLDPSATFITPSAVHQLSVDVQFFASFATSSVSLSAGTATTGAIEQPIVHPAVDELFQSVALMASENPKDFSDIDQLHSGYGKVDAHKGNLLLGKVLRGKEEVRQRKLP